VRREIWQRDYLAARTARGLIAHGRLQKQNGVIHVLASKLEPLLGASNQMRSQSRDFH